MSYCGEQSLSRYEGEAIIGVSLRCRAWTCPDCAEQRKRQLIAQCHEGAPDTFLTLTHRRVKGIHRNDAALRLTRAWRLLRLRVMRKYKIKKLPFAAVMEAHESGYPHLHILLRSIWIDQEFISAVMAEIIDSPIVYIERIDNKARVAGYVAKYCGKCAHKFGTAKRYFFSRDYSLKPVDKKAEFKKGAYRWDRQEQSVKRFASSLAQLGYLVSWQSVRQFTAERPP